MRHSMSLLLLAIFRLSIMKYTFRLFWIPSQDIIEIWSHVWHEVLPLVKRRKTFHALQFNHPNK